MATQKQYNNNPLTQDLEVMKTSKSKALLRFVLVFLSFLGVAFLFAILLFTFFKSPKEMI